MRQSGDLGILLGEALARVDHDDADVGPVDGHLGADDAVFSMLSSTLLLRRRPAVSISTYFPCSFSTAVSMASRVVPAMLRRCKRSSPAMRVDKGGFSDVGFTDDGHLMISPSSSSSSSGEDAQRRRRAGRPSRDHAPKRPESGPQGRDCKTHKLRRGALPPSRILLTHSTTGRPLFEQHGGHLSSVATRPVRNRSPG